MRNQHFSDIEDDVLYHIALGKKSHDLKDMFHDVKVSNGSFILSLTFG